MRPFSQPTRDLRSTEWVRGPPVPSAAGGGRGRGQARQVSWGDDYVNVAPGWSNDGTGGGGISYGQIRSTRFDGVFAFPGDEKADAADDEDAAAALLADVADGSSVDLLQPTDLEASQLYASYLSEPVRPLDRVLGGVSPITAARGSVPPAAGGGGRPARRIFEEQDDGTLVELTSENALLSHGLRSSGTSRPYGSRASSQTDRAHALGSLRAAAERLAESAQEVETGFTEITSAASAAFLAVGDAMTRRDQMAQSLLIARDSLSRVSSADLPAHARAANLVGVVEGVLACLDARVVASYRNFVEGPPDDLVDAYADKYAEHMRAQALVFTADLWRELSPTLPERTRALLLRLAALSPEHLREECTEGQTRRTLLDLSAATAVGHGHSAGGGGAVDVLNVPFGTVGQGLEPASVRARFRIDRPAVADPPARRGGRGPDQHARASAVGPIDHGPMVYAVPAVAGRRTSLPFRAPGPQPDGSVRMLNEGDTRSAAESIVLDTGATPLSVTNDLSMLRDVHQLPPNSYLTTASDEQVPITHRGYLPLGVQAYFGPAWSGTLLSVVALHVAVPDSETRIDAQGFRLVVGDTVLLETPVDHQNGYVVTYDQLIRAEALYRELTEGPPPLLEEEAYGAHGPWYGHVIDEWVDDISYADELGAERFVSRDDVEYVWTDDIALVDHRGRTRLVARGGCRGDEANGYWTNAEASRRFAEDPMNELPPYLWRDDDDRDGDGAGMSAGVSRAARAPVRMGGVRSAPPRPDGAEYTTTEYQRAAQAHHDHAVQFGHMSDKNLAALIESGRVPHAYELTMRDFANARAIFGPCRVCALVHARAPPAIASVSPPVAAVGERIAVDIIPLLRGPSLGGNRYVLLGVDARSGYLMAVMMPSKSLPVLTRAQACMVSHMNGWGYRVITMRSDSEINFRSSEPFLNSMGIRAEFSAPGEHCKEIERQQQRVSLQEAKLTAGMSVVAPGFLDGELRCAAIEQLNRTPNSKTSPRTPLEVVTGRKPHRVDMVFGEFGVAYDHRNTRRGEPKGVACMVLTTDGGSRDSKRVFVLNAAGDGGSVLHRGRVTRMDGPPPHWPWPRTNGYDQREGALSALRNPQLVAAPLPPFTPNVIVQTGAPVTTPAGYAIGEDVPGEPDDTSSAANEDEQEGQADLDAAPAERADSAAAVAQAHQAGLAAAAELAFALPVAAPADDTIAITAVLPAVATPTPAAPPADHGGAVHGGAGAAADAGQAHAPPAAAAAHVDEHDELPELLDGDSSDDEDFAASTRGRRRAKVDYAALNRRGRAVAARAEAAPPSSVKQSNAYAALADDDDEGASDGLAEPTTAALGAARHISLQKALKGAHAADSQAAFNKEMDAMLGEGPHRALDPADPRLMTPEQRADALRIFPFMKEKTSLGEYKDMKARFVVDGGGQKLGDLVGAINAPTVDHSTVYMMLQIAVIMLWRVISLDVPTAFLKTPMKPDEPAIYCFLDPDTAAHVVRRYPQYARFVTSSGRLYVRLLRYVYGLRQAPARFNEYLTGYLKSLGFVQSSVDVCLFRMADSTMGPLTVCIHVDDLLCSGPDRGLEWLLDRLQRDLDVTAQCDAEFEHLGMTITQDLAGHATHLSMPGYTLRLLEAHGQGLTPAPSPALASLMDEPEDRAVRPLVDKTKFASVLMTMLYLACCTRPDILLPVTYLATKMSAPCDLDGVKLKRILRYLWATQTHGITFHGEPGDYPTLQAQADASHHVHHDAKGQGAVVLTLGSAPIVCSTFKLKLATLSSTESELCALVDAAGHVVRARALLADFGYPQHLPTVIWQDNQSAIMMSEAGRGSVKRTKHMIGRVSFIKDLIDEGRVVLQYMPTADIAVDCLTKAKAGEDLLRNLATLCVGPVPTIHG
jgi:hypothetical protein